MHESRLGGDEGIEEDQGCQATSSGGTTREDRRHQEGYKSRQEGIEWIEGIEGAPAVAASTTTDADDQIVGHPDPSINRTRQVG